MSAMSDAHAEREANDTGDDQPEMFICPECLGDGGIDVMNCGHQGCACPCDPVRVRCPTCHGIGEVEADRRDGDPQDERDYPDGHTEYYCR